MSNKIFFLGATMSLPTFASYQQEKPFPDDAVGKVYEYLSGQRIGYLDIYQISAGRGNAAYLIFPDGTTILLDAGNSGVHSGTQEIMKAVPNDSKRPTEWITQYIECFSLPLENDGVLNYALLIHFDTDHIGQSGKLAIEKVGLGCKLTGITHVGNLLDTSILIDRGYPIYDYPTTAKASDAHIPSYKLYVAARNREGKKDEGSVIGSNGQIKLSGDPGSYPTFEVCNIVSSDKIWTGDGTITKEPVPSTASSSEQLDENRCSCGIYTTYGNFDYFSVGDILGVEKVLEWSDIEIPVARLLGEMNVVVANHHVYPDIMCGTYIPQAKPQVYVIPIRDYYHSQPTTLSRMLSRTLYPGERSVFVAGMADNNRNRLGEDGLKMKPAGHVVTHVHPGGEKLQIFVLNDRSEVCETLYKAGEIKFNN